MGVCVVMVGRDRMIPASLAKRSAPGSVSAPVSNNTLGSAREDSQDNLWPMEVSTCLPTQGHNLSQTQCHPEPATKLSKEAEDGC